MGREITDPAERAKVLAALGVQSAPEMKPLTPRLRGSVMPEMPRPEPGASSQVPILETPVGQFAEGLATPAAELVEGARPGTVDPATLERMRAPGGLAKTVGRIGGEVATAAGPAGAAFRAARLGARGLPILRSAMPLGAESATVAALEGAKAPGEGQTRLGRATEAGLWNVAGGAAMGAAARAYRPGMFRAKEMVDQEEAFLRSMGVEPRLPLILRGEGTGATSRAVQWLHGEPLRALPLMGPALKRQTDEAVSDWREAILKTAVPESARDAMPMPAQFTGQQAPVRNTIGAIQDWYKQQYREVLDPYAFNLQSAEIRAPIQQAIAGVPDTAARKKVAQSVDKIFRNRWDKYGAVTGEGISNIKGAIYEEIARKKTKGDAKRGYFAVLRALDEAVKRRIGEVNPRHAQRYGELAGPYRNLQVIEEASIRSGSPRGEFIPRDLKNATVAKVKREGGRRGLARGEGPLFSEAERAFELYDPAMRFKNENLYKALALGGSVGGIATAGTVPTAGLWGAIGGTVPMGTQRMMMGQLPTQQRIRRAMERPVAEEAARAARLAGTYYMTE